MRHLQTVCRASSPPSWMLMLPGYLDQPEKIRNRPTALTATVSTGSPHRMARPAQREPSQDRPQRFLRGLVVMMLVAQGAFAQAPIVDPNSPPIQTDRPSFTAGAALVPQRSLQIEAGAKRTSSSSERKLEWGQVLLRYGLIPEIELRLGTNSYNKIDQADSQQQGLEDTTIAAKFRLLGEAQGVRPAVSLLPGITLPSGHSSVSTNDVIP